MSLPDDRSGLRDAVKSAFRRFSTSSGGFAFEADAGTADCVWNHMDKLHRPCVHRTYGSSLSLDRSARAELTLTGVGEPFVALVNDRQLGPGRFCQDLTLFGVFYVRILIFFDALGPGRTRIRVEWTVVSHALLRWLHGALHFQLRRMNLKQKHEDDPIRLRRAALRSRGYSFATDSPDFVNSNEMTMNVRYPRLSGAWEVPAGSLAAGRVSSVSREGIDLLVRKEADGSLTVWNGVCPHEGGVLEEAVGADGLKCLWHGLVCRGLRLSKDSPAGSLPGLRLALAGETIRIEPD